MHPRAIRLSFPKDIIEDKQSNTMSEKNKLSAVEKIKVESDALRGTIRQSLQDEITGAIREDDQAVIKFHGMYQQDDRDRREQRAAKKLDPPVFVYDPFAASRWFS
ncbi:MAG: hypothetical protein WKI04_09035 [Ferruginibacter sp.]